MRAHGSRARGVNEPWARTEIAYNRLRARPSALTNEERVSRNFKSDNVTPVCDAIMAAIQAANRGSVPSYRGDDFHKKLHTVASEVFDREVAIFPVTTGTAANALALSQCVPPYGAVYCHDAAHIVTDEGGAPGFFTGSAKMIGFPAADGKIRPEQVASAIAFAEDMG